MELFLLLLILCVLVTAADGNSAVRISVPGGSDVVLPCSLSSKENLESKLFDWKKVQEGKDDMEVFIHDAFGRTYDHGREGQDKQFKGRVSHFPHELKNGNASIKIKETKVSDSGSYTCHFPDLQPKQTFQLVVECGPILKDRREENVEGACPKPFTRRIKLPNEDQALLECVVEEASVNPKVEWKDSSGKTLTAEEIKTGDSNRIILQTTVTETDTYICVVTQEDICHQVQGDIYVSVNDAGLKPYVTSLQTEDGLLLQCEVHGVSSSVKVELKDSSGGTIPAVKSQSPGRGGSFNIILQTTVTKSDTYSCEVTSETNQTFSTQIDGTLKGDTSAGWIAFAVVSAVLVIVVVVLAVLLATGHISCRKDEKKRETVKGTESQLLPA